MIIMACSDALARTNDEGQTLTTKTNAARMSIYELKFSTTTRKNRMQKAAVLRHPDADPRASELLDAAHADSRRAMIFGSPPDESRCLHAYASLQAMMMASTARLVMNAKVDVTKTRGSKQNPGQIRQVSAFENKAPVKEPV